jgi:hypothetical protein
MFYKSPGMALQDLRSINTGSLWKKWREGIKFSAHDAASN